MSIIHNNIDCKIVDISFPHLIKVYFITIVHYSEQGSTIVTEFTGNRKF